MCQEYAFVENQHVRLIIIDEIIFQHTLWLVDHWPLYWGDNGPSMIF